MAIPILASTETNQKKFGRNAKFSVYFDWMANNWTAGATSYDHWMQCYEILSNGTYEALNNVYGNAAIGAEVSGSCLVVANSNNKGNGYIETSGDYYAQYTYAGEGEKFSFISIDNEVDNFAQFIVKGETKSTGVLDDLTINEPYGFDNVGDSFVKVRMVSGSLPFQVGDTFTLYPAITTKLNDVETTVVNGDDNTSSYLIDGGPDFLYWDILSWISEGNVRILIRSASELENPRWSDWYEYTNNENIASEQARRYLQFKVILLSTESIRAKISQIQITYKVKAHTNNTDSELYEKNFNDISSIRISRSKEFITAGYGAADCDITLNNAHRQYSIENISSKYYKKLQSNLRFIIELGFDTQTIKKIEAFATDFKLDASGKTVSIRGQDYVKMFLSKNITNDDISSRVFLNKPIEFLVQMLCIDSKFPIEKIRMGDITVVDENVPYAYFKDKQVWQELQNLLLAYECAIYISEDGYLNIIDRFKKKNIYKSPRYSESNTISGTAFNISNGDLFLIVKSIENNETILYQYDTDYHSIDTNVLGITYCPDDKTGDFGTIITTKTDKIIRATGDTETPIFNDVLQLGSGEFTNVLVYNPNEHGGYKYLYGILKNISGTYSFYRYRYLDGNNTVIYPINNKIQYILTGFDSSYTAPLPVSANSTKTATMYKRPKLNPASYTILKYGTEWKFIGSELNRVQIFSSVYNINYIYEIQYVALNPVEILSDISYPDKQITPIENFESYIFSKSIISDTYYSNGYTFLVTVSSGNNLFINRYGSSDTFSYSGGDVAKYLGGVCDSYTGNLYFIIEDLTGRKKILKLDIKDIPSMPVVVETGDYLEVDELYDSNLNIYDIIYDEYSKFIYIAAGYSSSYTGEAILFRYKESYIDVQYENTVGKPLKKAYANTDNINNVFEKQYHIFFQKRGGIGAVTSQIWSWFNTSRSNEDKLKSAIEETVVTGVPVDITPEGYTKYYELPIGSELLYDDIEYVYVGTNSTGYENIGTNYFKDKTTNRIVLYEDINTAYITVKFGSAKVLKKYFGEYLRVNSLLYPSLSSWDYLSCSSPPYLPSRLRFTGENLLTGHINVSGYDINNNFITENLYFIPASGYVESVATYKKGYAGLIKFDASEIRKDSTSELICESTYEDLIPGVDLSIYVNPDETEEQFGGNGLVTSFTNEAAINVSIKSGIEVVSRFIDEKAVTALTLDDNGSVYGATAYIGRFFIYATENFQEDIYDFIFEHNSNITKLDYEFSDNDVKNVIKITAKKKEVTPYRQYDIWTGMLVDAIPLTSPYKQWAALDILYKTESPYLLDAGDYYESDINFSNPVFSVNDNVLRFNAHFSEYGGTINYTGGVYSLDTTMADRPSACTYVAPYFRYYLNTQIMNLDTSGQCTDPYTGIDYWINIPEAEKRNMEVYIGDRKLYYVSGEVDYYVDGSNYIMDILQQPSYSGGRVSIHYPIRQNATQDTLIRNLDTSGDPTIYRDYLWSIVDDIDIYGKERICNNDGALRYYYFNKGGFQLDVLWPNRSTYAETTYLRIENPASNNLDAYYDPEANPSAWSVWIDKIEIRGLPVIDTPVTIATEKDLQSIDRYFEKTYSIDNDYIQTVDTGRRLARYILTNFAYPVIKPSIEILANVNMQLGDLVSIYDPNTALDGDIFEVISISDKLSNDSAYLQDIGIQKLYDKSTGKAIYGSAKYSKAYRYS